MIKILGILLACFIVVTLITSMVNIVRDRSRGTRVVRGLTLRVVASILLFIVVMIGLFLQQGAA